LYCCFTTSQSTNGEKVGGLTTTIVVRPNDHDRDLFALPARLGGLDLCNPARFSNSEYSASKLISEPLMNLILEKCAEYTQECFTDQTAAKSTVYQLRRQQAVRATEKLKPTLSNIRRRAMDLASEKGASSWLTSLPVEEYGFCPHRGAFRDALALRYWWSPQHTPMHCVCGASFTVEHALSCPRGGFPIVRHNEIRDVTANLLTKVCHDVIIEPDLQPLTGETLAGASSITMDGAKLDIAVNGFWGGHFEKMYLDVRVFLNRKTDISNCYRRHEAEKKCAYEQRIREVEHSTFTSLVFSATGGMAKQSTTFYKRLASPLAVKWDHSYSSTLSWLRCRISFSLLWSAIQSIRGARSSPGSALRSTHPVDLMNNEARIGCA